MEKSSVESSHLSRTQVRFATGPRSTPDEICVRLYSDRKNIPYEKFKEPSEVPVGWIPVGTIEWVLGVTGWEVSTDTNYPEWLSEHFHRKIWKTNEWPTEGKVFVKPADTLKKFTGFVTDGTNPENFTGPFWCSEVLHFSNEWRYYVSHGVTLDAAWYLGEDDDAPPPDISALEIRWPENWVGSVDFGMTERGLTLVEAHEPFAVGNYLGYHSEAYPEWLIDGWNYLQKKYRF